MSGCDFRSFLAGHQSQFGQKDNKRLLVCALEGKKLLYAPIDYEKLSAITKIKHSAGEKALLRFNELSLSNKESKERFFLQEHRRLWELELHNLISKYKALHNELEALRSKNNNSSSSEIYDFIKDYEVLLKKSFDNFKEATVVPVYNLRSDIQHWLKETQLKTCSNERIFAIQNLIKSVKEQQSFIIQQLKQEQSCLEEELSEHLLVTIFDAQYSSKIFTHPPNELVMMMCPDQSLKESCLVTFQRLNEKYMQNITDLKVRFNKIDSDPLGGWSKNDNFLFKSIFKQYSKVTHNKRNLFMDRLRREMPHMSSSQLISYEKWWLNDKLFKTQLKDIFQAWRRDRDDLTTQVKHLIQEAQYKYEESTEKALLHQKQKFICENLHEKLHKYQEEMEEILQLEAKQRTLIEEKRKEKEKKSKILERQKKKQLKMQIDNYKAEVLRKADKLKEMDTIRLKELQEERAKQRYVDEERVRFREEIYLQKLLQRKEREKSKEELLEMKERVLQSLRDQVSVTAKSDPLRIIEHTEASKAHIAAAYDLEKEAQEPLFHVHTYSVDQIAADKRLKVEAALRSANIHTSNYARDLLAHVPPPTKPRKDNQSTIFKFE